MGHIPIIALQLCRTLYSMNPIIMNELKMFICNYVGHCIA